GEQHLEHAARDLAAQHALLALDEAGVVHLAAAPAQPERDRRSHDEDPDQDQDAAAHGMSFPIRRSMPPSENWRTWAATSFSKPFGYARRPIIWSSAGRCER